MNDLLFTCGVVAISLTVFRLPVDRQLVRSYGSASNHSRDDRFGLESYKNSIACIGLEFLWVGRAIF